MHQDITNRDLSMETEINVILEKGLIYIEKAGINKYEIAVFDRVYDTSANVCLNDKELIMLRDALNKMLDEHYEFHRNKNPL
jgi:hypothetical protein